MTSSSLSEQLKDNRSQKCKVTLFALAKGGRDRNDEAGEEAEREAEWEAGGKRVGSGKEAEEEARNEAKKR